MDFSGIYGESWSGGSAQPSVLENKLRQPIEATLAGRQTPDDLFDAVSEELEIVRGHYQKAPKTKAWDTWRLALEVYFEALEMTLEMIDNNTLGKPGPLSQVYAKCAKADTMMSEVEEISMELDG